MKNKINLIIATFIIILTSCQKQPSADFKTDKSEYVGGDVIKLTSTSIDASKFKWTFPDGQTSASENVDYTLPVDQQDATLTFMLKAISNNGKKSDDASKTVTVKAATGQALIWTSNSGVNPINVTIDNISAGTITAFYSTVPNCGDLGCVTANLKVGTYSVSATDGSSSWTGSVTVIKNGCSSLQLQ